jgi:hypothetical protein
MKYCRILISVLLFLGTTSYAAETAPNLRGRYVMKMTIGSHVFADLLDLEGPHGSIPAYGRTALSGFLTVTHAFHSPLRGQISCGLWVAMCSLDFAITAHENGQAYEVFYKATLSNDNYLNFLKGEPALLTGTASHADGTELGHFEALQL